MNTQVSVLARDINLNNLILKTDSYKFSHWEFLPDGVESLYSYGESRGSDCHDIRGTTTGYETILWYGLQGILKRHFSAPITKADVDEAEAFVTEHIGPNSFNRAGWDRIVNECGGKLPLRIHSIKEGTLLPTRNVLWAVEPTRDGFGWLVSYLESLFLQVWYPTTVATISYHIRQLIQEYFDKTVDDEESGAFAFKLYDFGFRGAAGCESAGIGGSAHMVAGWMGSDTVQGVIELKRNYGLVEMPTFSVRATEHSVVCANSIAESRDDRGAIERVVSLLEKHKGIIACVGDTYSIYQFTDWVSTEFKDRIANSGGTFVVRPDSGDATTVPVEVIVKLMDSFGYTVNKKGYRVLPPYIRVLQGDGINEATIRKILSRLADLKISADNIVFGMGGALLQHCDRDWLKFAMKTSSMRINGNDVDLYKDPITDSVKRSKKGRVVTFKDSEGNYFSDRVELADVNKNITNQMRVIWENGELLIDDDFDSIKVS